MNPREGRIEELMLHAEWLRRLARRLVLDPHGADDLVQDTWVAALRSDTSSFRSARGWLASILRNLVRQRAREEGARKERERRLARPERVESTLDTVARTQAMQRLVEVVLALDEPYRTTLLLHFQDGLTADEIARRDSLPASTVRSRIARGLAELRSRLERRDGRNWAVLLVPFADLRPTVALGGASAVAGALAMKKIVAALVVVVLAGWFASTWDPANVQPDPAELARAAGGGPVRAAEAPPAEHGSVDESRSAVPDTTSTTIEPAVVARNASLTIRVTWGRTGAPASDVIVQMIEWSSRHPLVEPRSATTGADGTVRFEDVTPGSVTVNLDRSDGEQVRIAAGEQRELDLAIPPGIRVRGRVVDAQGSAVAGARIWLSDYGNGTDGRVVARSDAAGEFVVEDVGDARTAGAFASGFAPSCQRDVVAGPNRECVLALELGGPGGSIDGVVLGPDRAPIAGARVLVGREFTTSSIGGDGHVVSTSPPQSATTDARGRFVVDGIALGTVQVSVRSGELAPWIGHAEVTGEGATPLEIVMQPGVAIEGTVRAASGAPLERVFVGAGEYGRFLSSQTYTDEQGAFRLVGLAPGSIEVRARAKERGDATSSFTAAPGQIVRWDPVLEVRAGVSGVVVEESGEPIAGWLVGAIRNANPGLFLRNTTTDAAGRFQLDNVPADAEAVEVREPGLWVGPAAATIPAKAGDGPLRIVVRSVDRASASIAGRVLGPDGTPLAELQGATLWAAGSRIGRNGTYDADRGLLEFAQVKPGRYRLELRPAGFGTRVLERLEVLPDARLDLGEIRFAAPGRIHASLIGSDAQIAEAPRVSIRDADGNTIASIETTGGEGVSAPLDPGVYRVSVDHWSFARRDVEVRVDARGEAPVQLALEPGVFRRFTVEVVPGAALPPHVEWEIHDSAGQLFQRFVAWSHEGRIDIFVSGLVTGRYSLEIAASDGRRASTDFDVTGLTPPRDAEILRLR